MFVVACHNGSVSPTPNYLGYNCSVKDLVLNKHVTLGLDEYANVPAKFCPKLHPSGVLLPLVLRKSV